MTKTNTRRAALLAAAALLPGAPALAQAPDAGSETPMAVTDRIVVTAQRREQSAFDLGLAVEAIDGATLAENRISQVRDIDTLIANVNIKDSIPGATPVLTVRGVGLEDFSATNNPSAGVYVDEVFLASTAMMDFAMFDVARIELLKGPQGTLYGRNSTAGALNVITTRPGDTVEGYVSATAGDYGTREAEGAITLPIADTLSTRLSARLHRQDEGFWTSRNLPGDTLGEQDVVSLRSRTIWAPTGGFEADLIASYARSDSEQGQGAFFGTVDPLTFGTCAPILAGRIDNTQCIDFTGYTDTDGDPFVGDWDRNAVFETETGALTLRVSQELGFADLVSVSGWRTLDRLFDIDVDSTPSLQADFLESDVIHQWSQELRLTGTRGALDWIVGGFASFDRVKVGIDGRHDNLFATRTRIDANQDTTALALFGQADWNPTDRLTLTLGARYSEEKRSYVGGTTDLNPFGSSCLLSLTCTPGFAGPVQLSFVDTEIEDDFLSWRLGATYRPSDLMTLYASISTGFKSGGFFAGFTTNNFALAPFEPEHLTAYEAGFKWETADRSLAAEGSVFFYDYSDIQTFTRVTVGPLSVQRLGNVDEAEVLGGELSARWTPVDGVTLRAGLGLLDTELGAFEALGAGLIPAGNSLPNAPELTGNLLARVEQPVTARWSIAGQVDGNYSSEVFKEATNRPLLQADAYWVTNARLSAIDTAEGWEIAAWVRNLTDEQYVVQAQDTGIGNGNRYFNPPRTYGVTVSKTF